MVLDGAHRNHHHLQKFYGQEHCRHGGAEELNASNSETSYDNENEDDENSAAADDDLGSPREELPFRHLGARRSPVRSGGAWTSIQHHHHYHHMGGVKRAASPMANGGARQASAAAVGDGSRQRWSKLPNCYTIEIDVIDRKNRKGYAGEECREDNTSEAVGKSTV